MKSLLFKTILPLIVIFFHLPLTVNAETLSVRADAWPPFNAEPNSELPGYGIEVLKAIFEPQGVTIDYQTMPWKRTLADMQEGKYDAAIGASEEEATGCIIPEEPIGMTDNAFFVKKGSSWKYTGVDSLKTVSLACIEGYDYSDEAFMKYIESKKGSPEVQAMTGDDALQKNISKLTAGRVDTVIECTAVMEWTLKQLKVPAGDVVSAGNLVEASPAYVIFSQKRPNAQRYSQMFSDGVKKLRASGELKKILDKYGIKDWK